MNVILFSLDTVRADRLSCYGYGRLTSPHLDRLAGNGAIFLNHHSPHIPTYPGHTTMMTGRDVYAHQVTSQSGAYLPAEGIPFLAEIFLEHGYFTGAADTLQRWFVRGFEDYRDYLAERSVQRHERAAEAATATALDLVNKAAAMDRPFFLFVHYWDAHTPYLPPAPFDRMFYGGDERDPTKRSMDAVWRCEAFRWYFHEWMPGVTDIEFPKAQYDAQLAYLDVCLARLFNRLQELDLMDKTLLVFTADHGEELDEHGCWFDHHGLYDTNTHIPLILHLPGVIPAGVRVPGMTAAMDVAPTILDYAGILDEHLRFDGCSLRPLVEGRPGTATGVPRSVLHMTENTWMKKRAVRTESWKLIQALEPDLHGLPPVELYRLTDDPGETRNLADEMPEKREELLRVIAEHVRKREEETGLPDPLPIHPVPLRKIGAPPADAPDLPGQGDEALPDGDFVGYAREERAA